MTKRAFIDAVRQYAAAAQRKHTSFAESVIQFQRMYLESCVESGMKEPELAKETAWAWAFLIREYAPSDAVFQKHTQG